MNIETLTKKFASFYGEWERFSVDFHCLVRETDKLVVETNNLVKHSTRINKRLDVMNKRLDVMNANIVKILDKTKVD